MRTLFSFTAVILIIVLAGCSGGMTCRKVSTPVSGNATCTGSIDQLEGTRQLRFDLEDVSIGLDVNADITVSVTGGALVVRYTDAFGDARTIEAVPGNPAVIREAINLEFIERAAITLEASGGVATGISYEANFTR